jgi:hypothetical protein
MKRCEDILSILSVLSVLSVLSMRITAYNTPTGWRPFVPRYIMRAYMIRFFYTRKYHDGVGRKRQKVPIAWEEKGKKFP